MCNVITYFILQLSLWPAFSQVCQGNHIDPDALCHIQIGSSVFPGL